MAFSSNLGGCGRVNQPSLSIPCSASRFLWISAKTICDNPTSLGSLVSVVWYKYCPWAPHSIPSGQSFPCLRPQLAPYVTPSILGTNISTSCPTRNQCCVIQAVECKFRFLFGIPKESATYIPKIGIQGYKSRCGIALSKGNRARALGGVVDKMRERIHC